MGRTRARAYNGGLGAVPSVEEPLVRGRGTKSMMMMIKLKAYWAFICLSSCEGFLESGIRIYYYIVVAWWRKKNSDNRMGLEFALLTEWMHVGLGVVHAFQSTSYHNAEVIYWYCCSVEVSNWLLMVRRVLALCMSTARARQLKPNDRIYSYNAMKQYRLHHGCNFRTKTSPVFPLLSNLSVCSRRVSFGCTWIGPHGLRSQSWNCYQDFLEPEVKNVHEKY